MNNPLFPIDDSQDGKRDDPAIELIRSKVERAYRNEPDATQELTEAAHEKTPSKHQLYMRELSASGKSLAEIQTAWHHYYTGLGNTEKHEVWQEFYAANQHTPYQKLFQKQVPVHSRRVVQPLEQANSAPLAAAEPEETIQSSSTVAPVIFESATLPEPEPRTKPAKIKKQILNKVTAGGKLKVKHHFQSLLFGLGTGAIVLLLLLFSFFNEYIIAPFIQPSRTVSATPIILGNGSGLDTSINQVIIPKINVQIPLDFSVTSNDEAGIEDALEGGVVHYPSTVLPGQNGNAAFFGHSSNNIFNPGKYKFAFVLLHTLTTGDVFYITYNGQVYAYQVFAREIVDPSQVGVLSDTKGKTASAVLITCDPPGTSLHRLVVWGEQISPNVSGNKTASATATTTTTSPKQLADNGPTLWSRVVGWLEFWH